MSVDYRSPYDHRTNESLADLLLKLCDQPRTFSARDRADILQAAAKRLNTPTR